MIEQIYRYLHYIVKFEVNIIQLIISTFKIIQANVLLVQSLDIY